MKRTLLKEQSEVLSQDVRVSVFDILEKTERKGLDYHGLKLRQFLKPLGVSAETDQMKWKFTYKTENISSVLVLIFSGLKGS